MKKLLVCGLGSAMVLSSAAVFAEDVEAPKGTSVDVQFSVDAQGQKMEESIQVLSDGASTIGSAVVTMDMDGEEISIDIPDYMLITEDGTEYLNASSLINALASTGEISGIDMVARAVGITEDWVKLAPIDLSALSFDVKPFDIALPDFGEEMMNDLQAAVISAVKMDAAEDGSMIFEINDETLKAAAPAIDEFKNTHLGFVGDALTYVQDTLGSIDTLDVKPAIRSYLDAAAAGYAQANGASEEEGKAAIDAVIDMVVPGVLGQIAEQVKAVPVADIWNSLSVEALTEQMGAFDVKVVVGETITFEVTVQDQTINGTVEMTEEGAVIELFQGEEKVATVDMTITENGMISSVSDAEGNVITYTKSEVAIDGENVDIEYEYELPSEDVAMTASIHTAPWEFEAPITVPEESNDILEVVKNVAAMAFAPTESAE